MKTVKEVLTQMEKDMRDYETSQQEVEVEKTEPKKKTDKKKK